MTVFDKIKTASSGVRIIEIGQSNEEIKKALAYVFALIGLRPENYPNDIEKMVLINFIRTSLSRFTVDEIKLAFELVAAKKIDGDLDHFQNFSAMYLGKVMKSYELEAQKQRAANLKHEIEAAMRPKSNITDDEKKRIETNFINEIIIPAFRHYEKTGVNPLRPTQCESVHKVLRGLGYGWVKSKDDLNQLKKTSRDLYLSEVNELTPRNLGEMREFKKALTPDQVDFHTKEGVFYLLVNRAFDEMIDQKAVD